MITTYKCPNCGGDMVYDEATGMLHCDHCGYEIDFESTKEDEAAQVDVDSEAEDAHDGTIDVQEYKCPNCGAVIVTDQQTSATICSFCGSPQMIQDRLTGARKPRQIIPFSINKDQAKSIFVKWTHRGILTPSAFTSQAQLEKITGIYVPFWLYDYDTDINYKAHCTRVRHKVKGDYNYTYTDHYIVTRHLKAEFDKVPADASKRMDDTMMDALEPFDYKELKGFDMPYLSGYYAEQYDYKASELRPRVETRVRAFGEMTAKNTVSGYATVVPVTNDVNMTLLDSAYTLMPVWMMNYQYQGKKFQFAVNGETGKPVGTLPISKPKAVIWTILIFILNFILVALIKGVLS